MIIKFKLAGNVLFGYVRLKDSVDIFERGYSIELENCDSDYRKIKLGNFNNCYIIETINVIKVYDFDMLEGNEECLL